MAREALVIRIDPAARSVERRDSVWSVADPRLAFTMLLELETRRRAGESTPRACVELPGGDYGPLRAALAKHLPWVEVITRSDDSAGNERAPGPLVTPEELAMLFELHATERHTNPDETDRSARA